MTKSFQTERRVEFRDTDAAGIVHFSVFFSYLEEAEHQLFRHLGLSIVSQFDGKTISWPRVAAKCDYRKSIRFEDVITIQVSIERIGSTSITWRFLILDQQGNTIAEGSTTTVCCEIPPKHELGKPSHPIPIEIPQSIIDKLSPYVSS